jgi:NTP pyrophosphatase (non-canonical NTP hydrolase)
MTYTFEEYEVKAAQTATYNPKWSKLYPALGLAGEAGEVADKVKKVLRDKNGKFSVEDVKELRKELGDVLWYIAALSHDLGFSLEEVARINVEKVHDRKKRGMIQGSGDNR